MYESMKKEKKPKEETRQKIIVESAVSNLGRGGGREGRIKEERHCMILKEKEEGKRRKDRRKG